MSNQNNNPGSMYGTSSFGFDASSGVGPIMAGTLPAFNSNAIGQTQAVQTVTDSSAPFGLQSVFVGEPLGVWVGAIILLFVLKFLSERKDSKLNPAYIKIGGYNVLAITLSAMIGIILLKVIFNKFQVPGVTQFANTL